MNKVKIYPGFENEPEFISLKLQSSEIFRRTDLYQWLKIDKDDASKAKIIKKYRELSLSGAHPDKGGSREEWNKVEIAYNVLKGGDKGTYDNHLNKKWWTAGENEVDEEYVKEVDIFLAGKKLRRYDIASKYLPDDLKDWENQLKSSSWKTIGEINSYVSRLLKIFTNSYILGAKIRDEQVEGYFSSNALVKKFEGLQSKSEIERKMDDIIRDIENRADNDYTISNKFKTKRVKAREIQKLDGWNDLNKSQQDSFLDRIKNALAGDGKTVSTVIKGIINEAKEKIKEVQKNKPKKEVLDKKKEEFKTKLRSLQGWNTLLESWEQDHLEDKIKEISTDKNSLFNEKLVYAQRFIQGAHLRKYRAKFWNKLESLTDLQKEDMTDGDDMRKGKKTGERWESIKKRYSGVEPSPSGRLDGEKFVKMKLFLCYYQKEASSNWLLLMGKISKFGGDMDSGWEPSKGGDKPKDDEKGGDKPDSLTPYAKEAIAAISSQIRKTKGEMEEKILGANWKKRFENVTSDAEIDKIWEDFIDRISSYRKGKPNPWIGEGKNPPPPGDLLKDKKDKAIKEILEEAFSKDPVIDKDQLEKNNQNWENDINNALKEKEINWIKLRVLADIRNKRANKDKEKAIADLLTQAKQEVNWNNYEKLEAILKQIKEFRLSNAYKEKEQQIQEIESKLRKLNPDKFKETTKDNFDEQKKNDGLSDKDISDETQKAIDEAVATGDLDKKKQAEEMIARDGAKKKIDDVVTMIKKELGRKNLTKEQKEKLINKILQIIAENDYQKAAYQTRKSEVDALLAELRGDKKVQENLGISWPKTIAIATLIVLPLTVVMFIVLRARRRRLNRERKIN